MNPLKSEEIFGNWATLLLPINDDDTINYKKLEHEIDVLIGMRVNGIYSNGTAGEFYNQTEEEFDIVNTIFAEKCNASGMPFQIGCISFHVFVPFLIASSEFTTEQLNSLLLQDIKIFW